MIHLGYLRQDVANFSVLKLTEAARPLLRGEVQLILAKPRLKVTPEKRVLRKKPGELEYDQILFDLLRALRKRLADDAGVPPYVIFSDITLAEMAAYHPTTPETLLRINGVGRLKLQHYGPPFLDEIKSYLASSPAQSS